MEKNIGLEKNEKMEKFRVNARIMEAVAKAIQNCEKTLELVELDGLEFATYEPLGRVLNKPNLTKVYFRNCNLGDDGLYCIFLFGFIF